MRLDEICHDSKVHIFSAATIHPPIRLSEVWTWEMPGQIQGVNKAKSKSWMKHFEPQTTWYGPYALLTISSATSPNASHCHLHWCDKCLKCHAVCLHIPPLPNPGLTERPRWVNLLLETKKWSPWFPVVEWSSNTQHNLSNCALC